MISSQTVTRPNVQSILRLFEIGALLWNNLPPPPAITRISAALLYAFKKAHVIRHRRAAHVEDAAEAGILHL
jgi:hypothetical protein